MRTPFVPTDPVTARAIALHIETTLRLMRESATLKELENTYVGFLSYAKSEAVCAQIRDHVQIAFNETATTIKARDKNARAKASQDTTNRITGERD